MLEPLSDTPRAPKLTPRFATTLKDDEICVLHVARHLDDAEWAALEACLEETALVSLGSPGCTGEE